MVPVWNLDRQLQYLKAQIQKGNTFRIRQVLGTPLLALDSAEDMKVWSQFQLYTNYNFKHTAITFIHIQLRFVTILIINFKVMF